MAKPALLQLRRPGRCPQRDSGTILVLWALALSVLLGCMALGLDLGNLEQEAVNVQDAADSAALAGATTLKPALSQLVEPVVAIPGRTCKVTTTNQWLSCDNFDWLDEHYLYDRQPPPGAYCGARPCSGWWKLVGLVQQPGQLSDVQAFDDGTSAGPWTCAYSEAIITRHHLVTYCGALDTGVAEPFANWDLSESLAHNPALTATKNAIDIVSHYGLSPQWSACSLSYLSGQLELFLAEGWQGTTCLAYGVTAAQNIVFWAQLHVGGIVRTAWASGSPATLCSGLAPRQCS